MKAVIAGYFFLAAAAFADPLLTSWSTSQSSKYARVYKTTSDRTSGITATTWGSGNTTQASPAYSDVQEVSYSNTWVYVRSTGLASHVMGPWLNPMGGQFMFWPTNRKDIRRFPRIPTVPTTKDTTAAGYSGIWVNGVALFNALDGYAWDGTQYVNTQHTNLSYYWFRNAPVAESFNFDSALGHQPPTAVYHTHQTPNGLRYQLGDHISYNSSTKLYSESTSAVAKHSPILGWAHDGYPIYGPYGYGTALDANSTVRRMVSGYVKRDGSSGTDSVSSNLTTIPAWYARFRQKLGSSYSTTASTARPSVNSTYPLGTFAQDFAYLGDLGVTQGTTFDLDQYNGRYCVTPEYPAGTYAYFVALDSSNAATYPYVLGFEFYGHASGGSVNSITESVKTFASTGPNTVEVASGPSVNAANGNVMLTWTSVEGGTYKIEASGDLNNWATLTTTQGAAANAIQTSYTETSAQVSNPLRYYRVTRTALATYDQ